MMFIFLAVSSLSFCASSDCLRKLSQLASCSLAIRSAISARLLESSPCFASFSSRYFSASLNCTMYSSSTLGACAPWGCASVKVFCICSLWNCNMVFWSTCCALLMPAVGHALLCLLLALLFFACCWLCSSLPAVGYALVMGPWVPTLAVFFMGSRVPIPGCLFMGSRVPIPGCLFMGSVVQVTIVLRHRAFPSLALLAVILSLFF